MAVEVILAIETCVPEASVVLWMDDQCLFEEGFTSDRNHNSMVFEVLEEALAMLSGERLTSVIVGTGPGSYSGTRIGIAAGQGVALAHGCPAVGLGSFAATTVARGDAPSMAVGDARRGLYFVSRINDQGEAMAAELMEKEPFTQLLAAEEESALFTFDDPSSLGLDEELEQRVMRVRPEARHLIDVWHGLEAARREELLMTPLAPTYLRAPFTSKAKPGHPLLR